jgi:hypothetical protein
LAQFYCQSIHACVFNVHCSSHHAVAELSAKLLRNLQKSFCAMLKKFLRDGSKAPAERASYSLYSGLVLSAYRLHVDQNRASAGNPVAV